MYMHSPIKPNIRLKITNWCGSSDKLDSLSGVTSGKHGSRPGALALARVHCCRADQGAALKPGATRRAALKRVLASLGHRPSRLPPAIMTVNCDSR